MTNASHAYATQEPEHKALLHRLARIEGQLRGIQKLVSHAQAPEDYHTVAQQFQAARKAMDRAFMSMISLALSQRMAQPDAPDGTTLPPHALLGLPDTRA